MTAVRGMTGVALMGATGLVGERIARLLDGHPFFRLDEVVASARSAGGTYGDVVAGVGGRTAELRLKPPDGPLDSPVVLSALPGEAARDLEPRYARQGHLVCSNAAAFRDDPAVPLVVPEVNPGALAMLDRQDWAGALVTNPNCVVSGLSIALAPLHAHFGIEAVTLVTMQALSGAGRGGLNAWHTTANVIPHIEGEAEKIPTELHKVLGATFPVSVRVNRVPVLDGHLASIFVRLRDSATLADIRNALDQFAAPSAVANLPSAPRRPIRVLDAPDRPQPRLDLDHGAGMTVTVGGLVADPVYDALFSILSHNLARGAAGACLLNAELAAVRSGLAALQPDGHRVGAAM